jgi:hypothetical protein
MEVIEPFIVPTGVSVEERRDYLEQMQQRMAELEQQPTIKFPVLEDYVGGQLQTNSLEKVNVLSI